MKNRFYPISFKAIIKYFILFLFAIIVITEIILRIFFYEQLKTQKYPLIYRIDSIMGYSHIPNINSYICLPSIEKKFHLNNHGFIGKDFPLTKPRGEIRIAVVGNSMTEGIWYNSEENYVVKLQKKFEREGYKNVNLIICSMGGVNKDLRNYLHIKHNVAKFNPDVILFNVGIPFHNDNEVRENYGDYMIRYAKDTKGSRDKAIKKVKRIYEKKSFRFFYDISYIFRAYCKKYYETHWGEFSENIATYRENSATDFNILEYSYSLETSMKILSDLNISLKRDGINLIVWPFRLDDEISKLLKKNNISFINPNNRFDESMRYKHDGHLNEKGHDRLTKNIYPLLLKKLQGFNYVK